MWKDSHILRGPSDAFHSYFNGNAEYERRFYSNSCDSFLGSDYWQQSSSITSGASNNTNASKPSEN